MQLLILFIFFLIIIIRNSRAIPCYRGLHLFSSQFWIGHTNLEVHDNKFNTVPGCDALVPFLKHFSLVKVHRN